MRINEEISVSTGKVVLVPYWEHHVIKYHEWMKDPVWTRILDSQPSNSKPDCFQDIQEATASEPLTLEEEYAMQRSWRTDADKLTFIICRADDCVPGEGSKRDGRLDVGAMVGDVNLFISATGDDEGDTTVARTLSGELELMVAETSQQHRGYGKASLRAFLTYIARHESEVVAEFLAASTQAATPSIRWFDHFAVKIGASNHRSLALFEGLGFRKTTDVPSYFGEFELRLTSEQLGRVLIDHADGYREVEYAPPPPGFGAAAQQCQQ